jgi:uncharacterized protein (DUF2235 family)
MAAPSPAKTKRIVFCFDGTWNRLSADCLTNVAMLAQMVRPIAADGTPQIVYYDEGIGTSGNRLLNIRDGMFGKGMERIMREAYRFLIFNYEPGDEIFAFGFSRGAYTARSFIGFIRHAGIIDIARASKIDNALSIYRGAPVGTGIESADGLEFRRLYCSKVCVSAADRKYRIKHDPNFDRKFPLLKFRYLGVWDTVGALGVPDFFPGAEYFNRKYGFHNALLTSKIEAARHAVALDEQRRTFRATLFGRDKVQELNARHQKKGAPPTPEWEERYQERWFPGVHSAVGGGGDIRGIADCALEWVLTGARRAGLDLRDAPDAVALNLRPDPFVSLAADSKPGWTMRGVLGWLRRLAHSPRKGPEALDSLALPAFRRWFAPADRLPDGEPYRPGALVPLEPLIADWPWRSPPEWKSVVQPLEEYVIRRGDTLSRLAKAHLDDPKRWNELFELNRDRIEDPNFLSIGLTIRLPRKLDLAAQEGQPPGAQ